MASWRVKMRHHNEGYSIADDSPLLPRRYLSRPGYSSGWWYLGLCLGLALDEITRVHLVIDSGKAELTCIHAVVCLGSSYKTAT
jgi:hypothetical protein